MPLEDGPNTRGFDESFITPNCPTTDPLYIYIENGMVEFPADHRHKRDRMPNLEANGGIMMRWVSLPVHRCRCAVLRQDPGFH